MDAMKSQVSETLLFDFLNVTESAAIAAIPWVGSGNEKAADNAATNRMRHAFNQLNMHGTIVIGEGEIDQAPMLYIGEELGKASHPKIDIAVDPIEGTTPTVNGQHNAITVMAAAPEKSLLHAPDMYMEKMVVGPKAKGQINLDQPLIENMKAVANAYNKALSDLIIYVQDRPRHQEYIKAIREAGAKAYLFPEGDVLYAIAACSETKDADMFVGIGGAPEGVLSAVAVKGLGGEMQAKLLPQDDVEEKRCLTMGLAEPTCVLQHQQLVKSDDCVFVATGITDNLLMNGIRTEEQRYITQSLLITANEQKLRYIESNYPVRGSS